jgi:kynurenine formamidase
VLADQLGIDPKDFDHKTNNMEEISYLTTHTGTHFDSPWYYTETVQGEPALTIDQVPLEWCFGPGIWLDLSRKAPGR